MYTLNVNELRKFICSEKFTQIHHLIKNVVASEGISYLIKETNSKAIFEHIAIMQKIYRFDKEDFQVWRIDPARNYISCYDKNLNEFHREKLFHNQFPFQIEFYAIKDVGSKQRVIMLKSEY